MVLGDKNMAPFRLNVNNNNKNIIIIFFFSSSNIFAIAALE